MQLRATLLLSMVAILFGSLYEAWSRGALICWPIFLTNLTLAACVVYLTFAYATTVEAQRGGRRPWFAKAAWVMQAIALPSSFLVAVGYWLLVYSGGTLSFITPFTHGVNFLLMLLDNFLNAQPFCLGHGLFLLAYFSVYLAWSAVHFALGLKDCENNRYIYKVLDWTDPSIIAQVSPVAVLVIAPILGLLFWSIVRIRNRAGGESAKTLAKIAPDDATRAQQDDLEDQ